MEIVELCGSFTSCVSPCLYFDHHGQVGLGNCTLFVWGSAGQYVRGIDEFDSSTFLFKCKHGHGESDKKMSSFDMQVVAENIAALLNRKQAT